MFIASKFVLLVASYVLPDSTKGFSNHMLNNKHVFEGTLFQHCKLISLVIFRPLIMGEENHNVMPFFQILPNLHFVTPFSKF